MLATAVGSHSQQGIIFALLASQSEQDDGNTLHVHSYMPSMTLMAHFPNKGFIVEAIKNCWACTCKKIRRKSVVDQESNSSLSEEKVSVAACCSVVMGCCV